MISNLISDIIKSVKQVSKKDVTDEYADFLYTLSIDDLLYLKGSYESDIV
jgi:hypothetical protein